MDEKVVIYLQKKCLTQVIISYYNINSALLNLHLYYHYGCHGTIDQTNRQIFFFSLLPIN